MAWRYEDMRDWEKQVLNIVLVVVLLVGVALLYNAFVENQGNETSQGGVSQAVETRLTLNDIYGNWSEEVSDSLGHYCGAWWEFRPRTFSMRGNYPPFNTFTDIWPAEYSLDGTNLTIRYQPPAGRIETSKWIVIDRNTMRYERDTTSAGHNWGTSHRCSSAVPRREQRRQQQSHDNAVAACVDYVRRQLDKMRYYQANGMPLDWNARTRQYAEQAFGDRLDQIYRQAQAACESNPSRRFEVQ